LTDGATGAEVGRYPLVLSFQRLDVYRCSIEFLALVTELAESLPRGHAERLDQLVRSAESVVRNIAEASGRWSPADAAKHYKIARGEAMECVASLDILQVRGLVPPDTYSRAIELLERSVSMLTKLCSS
jgi:four helix bundle protein